MATTKYKKGVSGNAKGRPKGIVDRRTKWRDTLRKELPGLLKRLVDLAKAGDVQAIKLILDRVAPPLRPQSAPVEIPALATAASLTDKARAILAAVADGSIGTDQGHDLLSALGSVARIIETDSIAARVEILENRQ
jgi:hypothetical protein